MEELVEKIVSGRGTWRDLFKLAKLKGVKLSQDILDKLPDGELVFSEIAEYIKPLMLDGFEEMIELSALVQERINIEAGIGLKAVKGAVDESRVTNLIYAMVGSRFESADTKATPQSIASADNLGNFLTSAVTSTIKRNADYHESLGLFSTITRTELSQCCDWCRSLQGTYQYGRQPRDFFQVHSACTCVIDYKPNKGKWQRISYYNSVETDKKGNQRTVLRKRTTEM